MMEEILSLIAGEVTASAEIPKYESDRTRTRTHKIKVSIGL
jgi:hypothetical protein